MAETKQISFELPEITTMLLKFQGIHEGQWAVGFEFAVNIGNFGPTPDTVKPGAVVQISKMLLIRHTEGDPVPHVVDAAVVNPKPKSARKASSST